MARYRADGTHLWSVRLGDGGTASTAVAVERNGDVYVAGEFLGPVNFGGGVRTITGVGAFLVKLSGADGAYRWDRVFGVGLAEGLAVLDDSNIAVCGGFFGTVDFGGGPRTSTPANGSDNFVATYSTDFGAHVWSTVLTTNGDIDGTCGLATVGGDVVVTAGFAGTAMLGGVPLTAHGSEDIYVARYRGTDGAHVWSMRQGGSGTAYSGVIATDGSHLFVGGEFSGTVNLGGVDLVAVGASFDAFVASYNASDGSHVWSERFGGMGNDQTTSIASSSTRLAVGITFETDSLTIGTRTFMSENEDVAVARLNPSTGTPSAASTQFASSRPFSGTILRNTMALVYTADRLAGVGTFSGSTNLLGTDLSSAGGNDIASFRVDF